MATFCNYVIIVLCPQAGLAFLFPWWKRNKKSRKKYASHPPWAF